MSITDHSSPPGADRRLHHCTECGSVGTGPTHHPNCPRAKGHWTDPLTQEQRRIIAAMALRAARRFYAAWLDSGLPFGNECKLGLALCSADCSDLHLDISKHIAGVA